MKKSRGRPSSRERILQAAAELAQEVGAGNISLDAVAERAGISKGGLLYNYPTKVTLLRALVAEYVKRREAEIAALEEENADDGNACIRAVMDAFCQGDERIDGKEKPSGILAAIAEDPQLIDPIRNHVRHLVDRLRTRSPHPECALIAFLALEGMHSHKLLEVDALTEEDRNLVIAGLRRLIEEDGSAPPSA